MSIYCVWELSRADKSHSDELSTAQALDVVAQLDEVGVRDVVLIGGEANLRDDWTTIARALADRGITVNMTTGGGNLTPERIREAADAGLSTISISIDGIERTHDAIRGVRGAFVAATAAAREIASTQMRLAVNTQINRLSLPELPTIARLLVELGARAWQVQLTVATDRPELLLQPYELLELFPLLVQIKDDTLAPNDIQLAPANNLGYFGPFEHQLRAGGETGRSWAIAIEADGTLRSFRERTTSDLWGFCAGCDYADTCKGGCSSTAHSLLGRPGNNPYCIHRALQLAKQGRLERVVKVDGRFELVEEPLVTTSLRRRSIVALPLLDDRAVAARS